MSAPWLNVDFTGKGTTLIELPVLEEQISYRFLRDARALPLRETDDGIVVAMADRMETALDDIIGDVPSPTVSPAR